MLRSNEKWFWIMVSIIVCLAIAGPARADWPELDKLTADANGFGASVSLSGDYCIVGAPWDDGNEDDSGSAYIFAPNEVDPNHWDQQAKLTALDGSEGDRFGHSVSICGDYCIVGAYFDDVESGSAYIFRRDGPYWLQETKLTASDGAEGDCFGRSVSIDGDYCLVGAFLGDGNVPYAGSAYVFKRKQLPVGIWEEQAKLTASDGESEDGFGISVSINGDYCLVGAHEADACDVDSGAAYVFKRSDTSWSQQAKLIASGGDDDNNFGLSVSISGDYCIVGSNYADGNETESGAAYIFEKPVSGWMDTAETAKLAPEDGATNDDFGRSVCIKGDYCIVGVQFDDDNGDSSGSAYIYRRMAGTWNNVAKLTASDGVEGDSFGMSVSIDGDYSIVGANDSAYAFRRACPSADLSGDCFVDFVDFGIMAGQWLQGE